MKKKTDLWPVRELEKEFTRINFPEYQREPNVWSRVEKQRLIDSMLRQFDIASIYFCVDADGSIDCVDGRQRIGAIMSFLGKNQVDDDNGFELRLENEIYQEEEQEQRFASLQGLSFPELENKPKKMALARQFVNEFLDYEITIVKLSGSSRPEEFNLQFTRLNLGAIINSGEKLNTMVGDLRDECFTNHGIGQHAFLDKIKIPTRRFAKEGVAAQILAQVFSFEEKGKFTRTRHFDLQYLFKTHATLTEEPKGWIEQTKTIMDLLEPAFDDLAILRNRAITVSTVLLAWKLEVTTDAEAGKLARFIEEFLCRLQWQVGRGLDVDNEYRYLIDFQRQVTQASVESSAVEVRATMLEREYYRWLDSRGLSGDDEYRKRTGYDPGEACR